MWIVTNCVLAICIISLHQTIGATTRRHLEMIRMINMVNPSWNERTRAAPFEQIRFREVDESPKLHLEVKESNMKISADQIPPFYNVSNTWPQCTRITHPRNLGKCRSDWAVVAASVLTDRICIYLWGLFNMPISAYHVLTCCPQCGDGCNSGSAAAAWKFFETEGVVTGGDYHSQTGCLPYQMLPCDYQPTSNMSCSFPSEVKTPACPSSCIDNRYNMTTDRIYVNRSYAIQSDVLEIQKEILSNGPVQSAIMVFEDFLNYTGSSEEIYYHFTGELLGGMSVKIVGWGVDVRYRTDYWIVVNSWGSAWGLDGMFRIRRGTDECGIESNVIAGDPSLKHLHPFASR